VDQENKFLDQKSRRGSLDGQLLLTTVRDVYEDVNNNGLDRVYHGQISLGEEVGRVR
jgi:hypothetical protein